MVRSCGGVTGLKAEPPSPPPMPAHREADRVEAAPAFSSSLYDVLEYLDLDHEQLLAWALGPGSPTFPSHARVAAAQVTGDRRRWRLVVPLGRRESLSEERKKK
jgi:hypothetical protein